MRRRRTVWLATVLTVGLVAALPSTSSAVVNPGNVHAFGSDSFGQLGNGAADGSHTDQGPVILNGADDVAGGREHALALAGGSVYAWGSDAKGQVGNGAGLTNMQAPVLVQTGASGITTGHYHSLALLNGGSTVRAWGWNNKGQLGTATGTNSPSPRSITFNVSPVTQVAAGRAHSIALRADGTVWTWGDNAFGQLGFAPNTSKNPTPRQVTGLLADLDVSFVAGGRDTTFAVTTTGALYAWGNNQYGQAGTGGTGNSSSPRLVPLTDVQQVESGADHTIAVKTDGTVWTWGRNKYGQLGYSGSANRTVPTRVGATTLPSIAEVFVGRDHSIALTASGAYYTWGRNDGGQLGPGAPSQVNSPRLVPDLQGTKDAGGGQVYTVVLG